MAIGSAIVVYGLVRIFRPSAALASIVAAPGARVPPEAVLGPAFVYVALLLVASSVMTRLIGAPEPEGAGVAALIDPAGLVANHVALVGGGLACWLIGRRWVAASDGRFVRGAERAGRNVLRGIAGALAAIAVCQAALLATVGLIHAVAPDYVFPEHNVIIALRDPARPWWLPTALWLGAALLTPVAEELFFRGILQSALARATRSPGFGIIASSLLFGLAHSGQPQVVPALMLFGVILACMYQRSGSLVGPIVAHMLFNAKTLLWESLRAAA